MTDLTATKTTPLTDTDPANDPVNLANERRAELILGLRQLADFYSEHPQMPLPLHPTIVHSVMSEEDDTGTLTVIDAATALGVQVVIDDGQVSAERRFAGLRLRVAYCSRESIREWDALMSYYDAVRPDRPAGGAS